MKLLPKPDLKKKVIPLLISGQRLRLYYFDKIKGICGVIINLPEIEESEYGYNLEPNQELYALRYDAHHKTELHFDVKVEKVDEFGMYISGYRYGSTFVPWEKEFLNNKGVLETSKLFIEPCGVLFEKNKLVDILNNNIARETIRHNKRDSYIGEGIWRYHGGRRGTSKYENNLKNFIKLGQLDLFGGQL